VEVHDPGLPEQQGNVLHEQEPDAHPLLSKSHASLPFLETARLGHEDSLVATLKRSRNAMRRLGLDRMLAGKARSIAAMRWRGVAMAQGTLGNMLRVDRYG
jgi:hypothetical protein|tara:strand:+ start:49 stop:351 length:303 start_codon:yes stop_codon:yes gene_type:complete